MMWEDPEYRKRMSLAHIGKTPWNKGKRYKADRSNYVTSEETKRKIRETNKRKGLKPPDGVTGNRGKKGAENTAWKGGITPLNAQIRKSQEYILWRTAVFMRDDYTCTKCGDKGVRLQADHIKPFSLFPELRFAIDNGRTLCVPCHRETETYGGRILHYQKGLVN